MNAYVRRDSVSGAGKGDDAFHCGVLALIGRPNVGKSSLLNALVGQKLSITSPKAQTTRHSLRGVVTTGNTQLVIVDTPGLQSRYGGALNRAMNRAIDTTLEATDVVGWVVEAGRIGPSDRLALRKRPAEAPLILIVNKIDLVGPVVLAPFLQRVAEEAEFAEIIPVSARKGQGLTRLMETVERYLPEQSPLCPPDDLTDRSERFLAAELVREKVFRLLQDELPYSAGVEVEKFEERAGLRHIHVSIIVGKPGHKGIVIGARGEMLKKIASAARADMERLFGGKVFLETWVRVRKGWSDDEASVRRLGYG